MTRNQRRIVLWLLDKGEVSLTQLGSFYSKHGSARAMVTRMEKEGLVVVTVIRKNKQKPKRLIKPTMKAVEELTQ